MSNKIIKVSRNTGNAPKSLVSMQTVAFSHYNNISAQLPIDPISGKVVVGGVKEQAKQCLTNIKAIVESINQEMDDVIKITIFLKNISDIDAVDQIYATFFQNYLPTRTAVAVDALPMDGALVQIEAIISNGIGTPPQDPCDLIKVWKNTKNAPISKVSTQTVSFSHYNHVSGQLPVHPMTNEKIAGGAREQTTQCMKNIQTIVESIDHVMDDIVKVNLQLKNMADLDVVNEVYTSFFKSELPARTTIGVSAIPMDALVQIDVVLSNAEGTPA